MLKLTEEEYGMLRATPAWNTIIDQMSREVHRAAMEMADGVLLAETVEHTAIQYATNVGRLSALIDIINYRPAREEDIMDGEKLEEDLM